MNIESIKQCIENIEKELIELKAYVNEIKVEKTPNQLRAKVIENSKYFVEYFKNKKYTFKSKVLNGKIVTVENVYIVPYYKNIDDTGLKAVCKLEFVVNADKSVVVALLKGYHTNKLKSKGIAKCMPGDVFNEHIGKAIALGRALGLDVSEFEQAVQPTEFVKGQFVNYENSNLFEVDYIGRNVISEKAVYFTRGSWMHDYELTIINDTDAIYKA